MRLGSLCNNRWFNCVRISYSIDSITLDITQSETGVWTATDGSRKFLHSILRGTELIIRSLSNLEEKLHQSFFFYVLPSPWTFVSIGEYFFPLFLLAAPLLFELLRIPHTTVGYEYDRERSSGLTSFLHADRYEGRIWAFNIDRG